MFLYEENVRVPYLIVLPGLVTEQKRVTRPTSVIDTAPTILDLLGLPIPGSYQGASLLDDTERMALLLTDYSLRFVGLRDGVWKFIDEVGANRGKLFRLDHDAAERQNLAATYPERTAAYRPLLTRWSRAQKELIVNGK
jgi:arylsulfatase A-like enzyme